MVMTRQEMADAAGLRSFDWARPLSWDNAIRAPGPAFGVSPDWFVWSYADGSLGGKPVNLAEAFAPVGCEAFQICKTLEYLTAGGPPDMDSLKLLAQRARRLVHPRPVDVARRSP